MHKHDVFGGSARRSAHSGARPVPESVPLIAQLGVGHRPLIEAHLLALPAEDRYLRFGHAIQDSAIARYVRRLRFSRDAAFGAFDEKGAMHGFAHLAFEAGSEAAELGISVDRSVRRQGVGLALLQRAAEHARNRGHGVLMMAFVPENTALASLARRAGMRLARDPAEPRAYLALEDATAESLLKEAFGEVLASVDLGFRLAASTPS